MRIFALSLALAAAVCGQTFTEYGAAAAGSVTGSAAGKKISDGITNVLGSVDKQTKAAATGDKQTAPKQDAQKVTPAAPASNPATHKTTRAAVRRDPKPDPSNVPPPPPVQRAAASKKSVEPEPDPPAEPVVVAAPPPPPPPPQVTLDELKTLASGTSRQDLLKLGQPAARVTMFEEGHLVEVYRYMAGDATLGTVYLSDGAVDNILLR